jgi:hypothetical protein
VNNVRRKDKRTSNLDLHQIRLPFLSDDSVFQPDMSCNHPREMIPAQQDQKKAGNHCDVPNSYVGICGECKLFVLCKDLKFHQSRRALDTPQDDRSCPLSAIMGINVLSFPQWSQESIIRLRVISEKRAREAASQFQMGNS